MDNTTELPAMKIEEVVYEECGGKRLLSAQVHCTL